LKLCSARIHSGKTQIQPFGLHYSYIYGSSMFNFGLFHTCILDLCS
jgi:hypothetical protein